MCGYTEKATPARHRPGGRGGSKGQSGRPARDGNQVVRRHRQSRDHRTTVQTGTQRYCGEDLPCCVQYSLQVCDQLIYDRWLKFMRFCSSVLVLITLVTMALENGAVVGGCDNEVSS